MRFASRMKGRKKILCQWRYRGSVKAQNMTMRFRRPLQGTLRKKIRSYATQSKKARNMTMRVRRPLQGTLRKKIRPYATQSKKVKTTRKPNCFLRSCARKKLNQSRKRYQNMRRDQRRRQNPKRR
ncbi:spermatid nuclear transition protein 3-like [Bubalus bubalis]|uniref:spermatid nuclear transition protein 3-like n=1 Tax=Bubalus bubalis TaxID=89462 RepID=UPI001E1B690E|nr:spermatid nuclear transition protein 3-like [Bubalus bubalis]